MLTRLVLVFGLCTTAAYPQDTTADAKKLEKALAELDAELRTIRTMLENLSRIAKLADSSSAAQRLASTIANAESLSDQLTAQQAYQLGIFAEERRQYESALDAFNKAIRLDPSNASAFLHRGHVNFELGALDLALNDANQSIQLQPDNSRAYELRANVHSALKAYDLSITDLQMAADHLDSSNPVHLLTKAATAEQRGDTQAAVELYGKAAAIEPGSVEIHLRRAAALRKLLRLQESVAECGAAVDADPNNAAGYICRSESCVYLGCTERALIDLDQAVRLNPKAVDAGTVISAVWRDLQISATRPLVSTATPPPVPPDGSTTPKVADPIPPAAAAAPRVESATIEANRTEPAVTPVRAAKASANAPGAGTPTAGKLPVGALANEQARTLTKKGRDATAQGRFENAIAEFTKAIEFDPTFALAYNSRGYALLRSGNYDRAIDDLTAAIQLDGNYANAYLNRGAARRLAGDADGAKADFRVAARLAAPLQAQQKQP